MEKPQLSDPTKIFPFLRASMLFQGADDQILSQVAHHLEVVNYRKGDAVVLEKELGDHVYFVFSGSVEVVKFIPELNQMARVAILGPGQQFSELSVIRKSRRAASVFALEDCSLLRMDGQNFLTLMTQHPQLGKTVVRHLARMTQYVQGSNFRVEYVKSEMVALNSNIPQIIPPKMWRKLGVIPLKYENRCLFTAVLNPKNAEFAEFIKRSQPNLAVYLYLVNDQDFDVLERELTAAYSDPSVVSQKPTKPPVMQVAEELADWLPKISIFKDMPPEWFPQMAEYFAIENYKQGDVIFRAHDPSEKFYLVKSGTVDVFHELNGNLAVRTGAVSAGDYLSETSLLADTPHSLSARAATDVTLAVLSKEYFEQALELPIFTLPLARDMVDEFQKISLAKGVKLFDPKPGVQLVELSVLIPKPVMLQYGVMPLRRTDDELIVGVTNPESETILSVIGRYLRNYRVSLEIISNEDFKKWFEIANAQVDGSPTTVGRVQSANFVKGDAVEILNKIIKEGFDWRASDIHFEPNAEGTVVRYRIDGVLREASEKYSKQLGVELVNRVKVLSKIDTTQKFLPQDGQLKLDFEGAEFLARVSTLPSKHGETMVLRLIRSKNSAPPLAAIAPDRRVIEIFKQVAATKQGVFLVTGPTGSGKSTTLYSLLQELNRVEVSVISLENPVEMEIAGATQVEINEEVGMTFSAGLRSALRQDPNVIMIGEIRDEESAKIAFHAASTGHLVISTLHTNNSVNVVPRLLELGISRGALASTLIGASAQRLLRQICDKCQEHRPIQPIEAEVLSTELNLTEVPMELSHGRGCDFCGGTGFRGRIPIIEVWTKTKAVEGLLNRRDFDPEQLEGQLALQGFETLRQFALKMVLNGLTTLEEVDRGIGSSVPSTASGNLRKLTA